jgi:hypothetical protein
MVLNVAGGGPLWAALDHETKDLQPRRVSQRAQLLGMSVQFRGHLQCF